MGLCLLEKWNRLLLLVCMGSIARKLQPQQVEKLPPSDFPFSLISFQLLMLRFPRVPLEVCLGLLTALRGQAGKVKPVLDSTPASSFAPPYQLFKERLIDNDHCLFRLMSREKAYYTTSKLRNN